MQHSPGELCIPLVSGLNIQKALARTYFGLMFQIVVAIVVPVAIITLFIRTHMSINMHGNVAGNLGLFLIFLCAVIVPAYRIWMSFKRVATLRRRQLASAEALRVNQDGIYFFTWIAWKDIEAIFPYTVTMWNGDHAVLGIVPRDYQAIVSRLVHEHSPSVFNRLVIWGTIYWVLQDSRFLAPINITQEILPLSVETVMEEIRTHFAAELEEYRIRCSHE